MRLFYTFLYSSLLVFQTVAAQTDHAAQIASLIDPAKLAALGERGANSGVQKAVCLLVKARTEGQKPAKVLDRAVALAGYNDAAAKLTKDALLRNLDIAGKLGCILPVPCIGSRQSSSTIATRHFSHCAGPSGAAFSCSRTCRQLGRC